MEVFLEWNCVMMVVDSFGRKKFGQWTDTTLGSVQVVSTKRYFWTLRGHYGQYWTLLVSTVFCPWLSGKAPIKTLWTLLFFIYIYL